jgi:hypothetical protein
VEISEQLSAFVIRVVTEAAFFSERSVYLGQGIRRHFQERMNGHSYRCEYIKIDTVSMSNYTNDGNYHLCFIFQ